MYYQDNNECDFIVRKRNEVSEAIQVCYELNGDNQERELNGLKEAMEKFKLKEGLILTYNQTDEFDIKGMKIKIIPVWKWLLSN